ncbi:MAG: glycerate kinase [Acidobacteriaceae bacterium]|nr:glycerate kinase [Acidobacteriaceae bacterium]
MHLPLTLFDRIFLVAAGKAAPRMAATIEQILGPLLSGGIVVTKRGHLSAPFKTCHAIEAGHPVPDEAGLNAAELVRDLLRELNARDLLIVAVSGGASALLSAPCRSIPLAGKQRATSLLLRAGASITELNTIRKHLSFLKGGGLAALAYPATVVGFLLSDVIGDPLDVIGSGLTAPDPSTFADALAILEKYELTSQVPAPVRDHLTAGAAGIIPETPKPGSPVFANVHNVIVGSNEQALAAAARKANELNYRTLVLSSTLYGESREVARVHAQILRQITRTGQPVPRPACVLAGGETTVTVKGHGKGGRNQEFALAAAIDIAGFDRALVLSCGTDGTDGPTDAAGAIATGDTILRAAGLGLDPLCYLAANDSYTFFDRLGDLLKTGPTGTNVMDIHILLAG